MVDGVLPADRMADALVLGGRWADDGRTGGGHRRTGGGREWMGADGSGHPADGSGPGWTPTDGVVDAGGPFDEGVSRLV
jgi:hypothetical protein